MHVITDKMVNSHSTFPEFIEIFTLVNDSGIVVFRTTDGDELAKHLSIQSRAELRSK